METKPHLDSYHRARKQLDKIKGFYLHLFIFCIVLIGLGIVNIKNTPEYLWLLWNVLGWGIGLLVHAMIAFDLSPLLNKNWEKQKMKEFMSEEMNKCNTPKFK